MAAGKPVKIAILADAREAVQGFDKAGNAAKDAGNNFDGIAEKSDNLASASAQTAGGLGDLGGALSGLPGPLGALGTGMEAAAPAIMGVTGAADLLNVATEKFPALAKAQVIATKAVAVAQRALNAVMRMSPFGLIILAIGALLLVLPLIIKHWDSIKAATQRVWSVIKRVVVGAVNAVKGVITSVFNGIKTYFTTVFSVYRTIFAALKTKIVAVFSTAASWLLDKGKDIVRGLWNGVKSLFDWVKGKVATIKSKVTDALSGAGTMLSEKGRDIVRGLWDGVKDMADWIQDKVSGFIKKYVSDPVKNALSIFSPSRLMRTYGRFTAQGLALGIEDKTSLVKRAAGGLAAAVESGFSSPTLAFEASLSGSGTSGRTQVEVKLTADQLSQLERGRAIQMDLDAYAHAGGRRRA